VDDFYIFSKAVQENVINSMKLLTAFGVPQSQQSTKSSSYTRKYKLNFYDLK
jgi:hypothetical protein